MTYRLVHFVGRKGEAHEPGSHRNDHRRAGGHHLGDRDPSADLRVRDDEQVTTAASSGRPSVARRKSPDEVGELEVSDADYPGHDVGESGQMTEASSRGLVVVDFTVGPAGVGPATGITVTGGSSIRSDQTLAE